MSHLRKPPSPEPVVRVSFASVVWDAMLRKAVEFLFKNTLGFLYGLFVEWTWKTLGGAVVLASIVSYFYAWWEVAPLHNTIIIFFGVFIAVMIVALYRQKAHDKTRAQQVLAEVKELPPQPNAATLMPDLAELWTRLDRERFWVWWSNATLNLYRKIEQDFRLLQDSLDEDSRDGIERALAEARDFLREKSKDI